MTPRRRLGAKIWLPAIALHAALTALFTFPAVLVAHRALIGIPRGDKFQFVWNFWWMHHALLERHQLPFFTDLQYHPTGVSLALHDMAWLWSLGSVPLQIALDPRVVLNLFLLISFPLNGLAFTALAREVSGRTGAALVGSIVFAYCPYFIGRFYVSHVQYLGAFFIPLFILCLWRYAAEPAARHLRWAGVWLALQSLVTFYYGLGMIAVLAVFLANRLWRRPTGWRELAAHTAGLALVSSLLSAPVAIPMAAQILTAGTPEEVRRTGEENVAYNSADLAAYFVPDHTMARWWGWSASDAASAARARIDTALHGSRFERSVFPGYLAWIALAGVLCRRDLRRRYAPFAALALAFVILGLGPTLHVAGRPVTGLPAALLDDVPIVAMLRSATRLSALAMVGFAMGVVGALADRPRAAGARWARAIPIGAAAFALLEFVPRPAAYFPFEQWLSPYYHALAERECCGAVLDIPVDFRDPRGGADLYEYAQVIHHRPIVGGYVSREPASVFAPLRESAFLRAVEQREYQSDPHLLLGDEGFADLDASLVRYGIGEVILHRHLLDPSEWERTIAWLEPGLGAPVYEDFWIRAYRFDRVSSPPDQLR